jgi:ABC-type transport system substrate-binding protein
VLASGLLGAALAAPVVYLPEPPTTLHPFFATTPTDVLVHSLVHDRLFHPAPPSRPGAPRSRVVADYTQEGTAATLTLQRGLTWHDGHPVDAGDVCFTIDALLHVRTQAAAGPRARAQLGACRVDPADPRTALLTLLSEADARPALAVPLLAQHTHDGPALSRDPRNETHVVGVGPYAVVGRDDAGLHLRRVRKGPPYPELVLAPAASPWVNAGVLADHGGLATAWVPPAALEMLRSSTDIGLFPWDRLVAWSLALDTNRGPTADTTVREALDRLLDRERLRRLLSGGDDAGREHPWPLVSGPFAVGSPRASRGVQPPLRDVEGAHELLREAGYTLDLDGHWVDGDGERLGLRVVAPRSLGLPPPALAAALGLDGIDVSVTLEARDAWLASVWQGGQQGHADAVLLPRPLFPDDDPSPWLHTRTEQRGWANVFDFSHPRVDRLLEELEDSDAGPRLHGLLADLRPHLFLFEERRWTAWRGPFDAWLPAPYDGWSRIDEWQTP